MPTLLQDLRYGFRVLVKNPGFTAVAVVTLALGIGANTALFSVVNGVLLHPLPISEPDQLVTLHESKPNFEGWSVSYPNFRDWQKDNHTFSAMAIFSVFQLDGQRRGRTGEGGSPALSSAGRETASGTFSEGEDQIGASPVVLIGARLWQRKFRLPDILGKGITLDGKDYTVVGIIPPISISC